MLSLSRLISHFTPKHQRQEPAEPNSLLDAYTPAAAPLGLNGGTADADTRAAAAFPSPQTSGQQQPLQQLAGLPQLTPSCSASTSSSFEGELHTDLCVSSSIGPCSTVAYHSASGSSSRRHSLLSESGRASRRASAPYDGCSQQAQSCATTGDQAPDAATAAPAATAAAATTAAAVAAAVAVAAGGTGSARSSPPRPPPVPGDPAGEPWYARRWSFGVHHEQNGRKDMEDRIAAEDLTQHARFVGRCRRAGFFAVFDGHSGYEAAEYLSQHLLEYVLGSPKLVSDPEAALQRAVEQAEDEIVARFAETCCRAGSTLLAVLMVDDQLYIANVGDCRAVMARGTDSTQLTRDHKPQCEEEARRIAEADPDAHITADGYIYGELAVARGIGSQHLKLDPSKRAFTFQPEMHTVRVAKEDDFVVLASDGLWDKVGNSEAVTTARRSLASSRSAETCARALVDRAQRQRSSDNISVVVLCLHDRAISLPKTNSRLFSRRQLAGDGSDSPRCNTPNSLGQLSVGTTPRSNTPVE